jgi:hypothetical protein
MFAQKYTYKRNPYLRFLWATIMSQGSSVSIVPDYGLDNWDSIPDRDRGFLF